MGWQVGYEEIGKPQYRTALLCDVVDCYPADLRAWRNRNGLFPEMRVEGTNRRPWSLFSIENLLVVRAVVVLISHGLPAATAVYVARSAARVFVEMLAGLRPEVGLLIGCASRPDEDDTDVSFSSFIEFAEAQEYLLGLVKRNSIVTLLDPDAIIDFVMSRLSQRFPNSFTPMVDG